jgi:hypothetical protein
MLGGREGLDSIRAIKLGSERHFAKGRCEKPRLGDVEEAVRCASGGSRRGLTGKGLRVSAGPS